MLADDVSLLNYGLTDAFNEVLHGNPRDGHQAGRSARSHSSTAPVLALVAMAA